MRRTVVSPSRRALAAAAAVPLLSSCVTLLTDPAPADGRATLNYGGVAASIVLPESARGRQIPGSPSWFIFTRELEDDHTVSGSVLFGETLPADKTDEEYLEWWAGAFERELPRGPGRAGAVLRGVERVGGTRTPAPAPGAHCVEYIWISEDRQVPGHRGEPFVMHAHEYVCIHPVARVLVRTHFSERFPTERSQLRDAFAQDVAFFFENLRLH